MLIIYNIIKQYKIFLQGISVKQSIVNIESLATNSFGTGFVIESDENGVYVLTCKHVLEDVVHPIVESVVAKVVATGEFIDMAVLYVPKLKLPQLSFQKESCPNLEVEVIGFRNFSPCSLQKEHIDATLYKEYIEIHSKEDDHFYNVRKIKAQDGFNFERGNSGSPVICKKTKKVIAMLSNKEGNSLAYAVNIDNLEKIWKEAPPYLFKKQEKPKKVVNEKRTPTIESPSESSSKGGKYIFVALLMLMGLSVGYIRYAAWENKREWINPQKDVCIANGGKVDQNGFCYANWRNAEKICIQSNAILPAIESLKEELTDCGGVLDDVSQEESRSDALKCYQEKGFLLKEAYWTSNRYDQYNVYGVHFGHPARHLFYYSNSNYTSSLLYVRCEEL